MHVVFNQIQRLISMYHSEWPDLSSSCVSVWKSRQALCCDLSLVFGILLRCVRWLYVEDERVETESENQSAVRACTPAMAATSVTVFKHARPPEFTLGSADECDETLTRWLYCAVCCVMSWLLCRKKWLLSFQIVVYVARCSSLVWHLLWRPGCLSVMFYSVCLSHWCIVSNDESRSSCDFHQIVAQPF